jgi:hypothetical protein
MVSLPIPRNWPARLAPLVPYALFSLLAIVAAWPYINRELDLFYDGDLLYGFAQTAAGLIPYKDFNVPYMPGLYYLGALCAKIFGSAPGSMHLGVLAIFLLDIWLLVAFSKKYLPRPWCWLAPLFFAVLGPPHLFIFLPRWIMFACALGSGLLLVRGRASWFDLGGMGFLTGLAFLAKSNVGTYLAVLVLFLLLIKRPEGLARERVILRFAVGFFLPNAVVIFLLGSRGALIPYLSWGLQIFTEYLPMVDIPYARPTADGLCLLLLLGSPFLAVFLAYFFLSRKKRLEGLAAAGSVWMRWGLSLLPWFLVAAWAISSKKSGFYDRLLLAHINLEYIASAVSVAGLGVWSIWRRSFSLGVLASIQGALFLEVFPRADMPHLDSVASQLFLGYVVLAYHIAEFTGRKIGFPHFPYLIISPFLLFLIIRAPTNLEYVLELRQSLSAKQIILDKKVEAEFLPGRPWIKPAEKAAFSRLWKILETYRKNPECIFTGPYIRGIPYLAGCRQCEDFAPTHLSYLSSDQKKQLVDSLSRHLPAVVIWAEDTSGLFEFIPRPEYEEIGSIPGFPKNSVLTVWVRKDRYSEINGSGGLPGLIEEE